MFLETDTIDVQVFGKTTPKVDFSGKGSSAFSFIPFQIYYRNHLCW